MPLEGINPLEYSNEILERIGVQGTQQIDRTLATIILKNVLHNPKLVAFLDLPPEDAQKLPKIINDFELARLGLREIDEISPDDRMLYAKALLNIRKCHRGAEIFCVADEARPGVIHLCLSDCTSLTLHEIDGKYFVYHQMPSVNASQEIEISKRLEILSSSGFFPETKIVNSHGKKFIAVQYISGEGVPWKTDITEFYEFCKNVGFGSDTNVTNFRQDKDGRIKYIDRDLVEWAIAPETTAFFLDNKITKPFIWRSMEEEVIPPKNSEQQGTAAGGIALKEETEISEQVTSNERQSPPLKKGLRTPRDDYLANGGGAPRGTGNILPTSSQAPSNGEKEQTIGNQR